MSDEALNKHLDWLDDCERAQAAVSDDYVDHCPHCGELVATGESCPCEEDDIPF